MFVVDDIINAIGGNQAAQQQEKAARDAMGLQRDIYNQGRSDQMPWMKAGQQSLGDLMKMMSGGYDFGQLTSDPGYQFRMAEGQKALERSAAARGGLNSGGFMKGLDRYSQGLASDEFGSRFGRLASIAGMGQGAASNLGGMGGRYADSMSNLYGALGNAQSAGTMAITNGLSGGLRSGVNIGMLAAGNPMPMMSSMGGSGGGYGGGAPSASSAYASNPGNYSLGNYNLIPPQGYGR